ncbi:MAG: aldehyde ferredoxin oxidoreductase [Promethearchaeota archaeon]|nr:MAG: aldehyde ferredoxin oxidoreductase [Candidatus Lokiarchaeota archaeon]
MEFRILRVNVSNMSCKFEPLPEKYKLKGGRGLTGQIIIDEIPPTCDPLGPHNKIIFSPGLLSGTTAPSSGRLSVGGKSVLTGTIKEANAGGLTGTRLGQLGIRAVIIEGWPTHDDWYNLVIKKDEAKLEKANEYHEMGLYELIGKVWEKYPESGIVGCGLAGQRLMKNSGIFGNNIENTDPGRYAGRGGLGAVLGSKRIIAVITTKEGAEIPQPKNKELYEKGRKKLVNALTEHPITGGKAEPAAEKGGLKNFGTNVLQNIINEAGALPTKNFRTGHFDGAKNVSGEAVHALVDECQKKYGDKNEGMYGHPCHPGCIMACSNTVPYENGKAHVSPLEYESAWSLGTNLMIDDLQDVAELNRLCNDLGMDTIEAGNTIAMVMDAGIIDWGDGKAAIELLKKAYDKTIPMGYFMMAGAKIMGEAMGVRRIPVVKGQSLPAYDPRPIRGVGVTYATSTMGADHTSGYTIAPEILGSGGGADPRDPKKAELSRAFQVTTAYIDQSGYCVFIAFAILDEESGMEGMVETLEGFLGVDEFDITKVGSEILKNELEFNRKAGFTEKDDRLPEFFYEEPVLPHEVVFDVSDEELDSVFKDF